MPHLTKRMVRWTTPPLAVDGSSAQVYIHRMPDIVVNGEARAVPAGATVAALLQLLELAPAHVAVERNREIVPKAAYDETDLREGDALEIVTFVGGG